MSLKAFHIVFITASALLCAGFGAWSYWGYREEGRTVDLVFACVSGVVAVALVVYGRAFLKKLKHISYF